MTGADELEKLTALRDELRELIREAHGATKDLNREIKAAKREIRGFADGLAEELIQREVRDGLDKLTETLQRAMDRSVQRVTSQFTQLQQTLLGRNEPDDRPSLDEVAQAMQTIQRLRGERGM